MAAKRSSHSFVFAHGWYKNKLDAQAVYEALDVLVTECNEHVTVDEIVIAAKKRESPMHDGFTWNDPEAAEKWRRREARNLVRNLYVAEDDEPTRTQAFYYVPSDKHGGKKTLLSTRTAMTRPETSAYLIERRFQNLMRSITYLEAVVGNSAGLERLKKNAKALRARAKRELMVATR